MKRLKNYRQDFLDLAKPRNNEFGGAASAKELAEVTLRVDEYLNSTWTLVYIYSNLSCEPDKAMVRSVAKTQVSYYVKTIEIEVRMVNGSLSSTKTHAIAMSGTQLKDDLREIIARLEAIKFN